MGEIPDLRIHPGPSTGSLCGLRGSETVFATARRAGRARDRCQHDHGGKDLLPPGTSQRKPEKSQANWSELEVSIIYPRLGLPRPDTSLPTQQPTFSSLTSLCWNIRASRVLERVLSLLVADDLRISLNYFSQAKLILITYLSTTHVQLLSADTNTTSTAAYAAVAANVSALLALVRTPTLVAKSTVNRAMTPS